MINISLFLLFSVLVIITIITIKTNHIINLQKKEFIDIVTQLNAGKLKHVMVLNLLSKNFNSIETLLMESKLSFQIYMLGPSWLVAIKKKFYENKHIVEVAPKCKWLKTYENKIGLLLLYKGNRQFTIFEIEEWMYLNNGKVQIY